MKLEQITGQDFLFLQSIFQNEHIMRFTLDDCFSDNDLKVYLKSILENNTSNDRKQFEYKVIHEDLFIGFADFEITRKMPIGGIAEIGYLLLPSFWNKGFGTLIAQELIRICFDDIHLHKVTASCNVDNIGSWKIFEKIGMKREGEFEAQRYKNGKFVNEYKYGIINILTTS